MTNTVLLVYLFLIAGILGLGYHALIVENYPAVINAIITTVVVIFPLLINTVFQLSSIGSFRFGTILPIWLALAGILHMIGMIGWYDYLWWWDHLTHTVSAGLLAALLYAALITINTTNPTIQLSQFYVGVLCILLILGGGIFWEFLELISRDIGLRTGYPPVLQFYGLRDTMLDIMFNFVGASLIILLDIQIFVPVTDQFPTLVESAVKLYIVVIVAGSILLGILLEYFNPEKNS